MIPYLAVLLVALSLVKIAGHPHHEAPGGRPLLTHPLTTNNTLCLTTLQSICNNQTRFQLILTIITIDSKPCRQ